MAIWLLSFGGGNKLYYEALSRLVKQSKDFPFDKVITYTDLDLKKYFPEFWVQHKDFILKNFRGYGYWIWKPYIILDTLKKMKNDDILLYLDCGCELNNNGLKRFNDYIELVKTNNRMLFHLENKHFEWRWNKMDLVEYLGLKNNPEMFKPQAESGMQFYKCCDENIKLLEEYYKVSCNYNLIDDSLSKIPNHPNFIEHRHDQSVISLLFKKYGYFTIFDETWPETMIDDKKNYPIWAIRTYNFESKIKY
jgi:hypothetical protein